MVSQFSSMSRLTAQLGFWAALIATLTVFVYIFCFVALVIRHPLFTWTTFADFVAYVKKYP